jgi:hypothetical protein
MNNGMSVPYPKTYTSKFTYDPELRSWDTLVYAPFTASCCFKELVRNINPSNGFPGNFFLSKK